MMSEIFNSLYIKLIKTTKDFNLIESKSDIDALFLDFKYNEE